MNTNLNRLNRLKTISAKSIDETKEVKMSFLKNDDHKFPMVIQPQIKDANLNYWIKSNQDEFNNLLNKYGALLFRDFEINTVEKFKSLTDNISKEQLEYQFRSSPRHSIKENVYVSTTYPNDQAIEMHCESSYSTAPPDKIIFCCIIAAQNGGQTPIADTRKVLEYLPQNLKDKFIEKGVMYRRNLNKFLGLSWQEVFQAEKKEAVEDKCKKLGINFDWQGENLIMQWSKKAICKHPVTQEECWFNHALFFNKFSLEKSLLNLVSSDEELPSNTFFGDGASISEDEANEIKEAYNQAKVIFDWEVGDVLFLDNMLIAHGRNPFEGKRKIIVSMY